MCAVSGTFSINKLDCDYINYLLWTAGWPDVRGEPACPEIISTNIFMNKAGRLPGLANFPNEQA